MDLSHRKTILQKISTGLYIVTGMTHDGPTGAVISFLTQTSLNPPLITMAMRADSSIYRAAKKGNTLAIHFPSRDQQDMVASFFKIKKIDKNLINGYRYSLNERNIPLLDDSPMILEVIVKEIIPEGDHHIFVTEVTNTILREDSDILSMHHTNWHYGG